MAFYHSGLRNLKECEGQKAEGKNLEANHLSNSILMCCWLVDSPQPFLKSVDDWWRIWNPSTWWKNVLIFRAILLPSSNLRGKKTTTQLISSVLTEMPGQADDPWVFAPQSSGIGQRNFIQSLGVFFGRSIGPMRGFKQTWCLGRFCWQKMRASLMNFRCVSCLGSLSKWRIGPIDCQRLRF